MDAFMEQDIHDDVNTGKDLSRSTRKRSLEKRKERNRKKKLMRRQRKHENLLKAQEKEIEMKERFQELEHHNSILKRHVKTTVKGTGRDPNSLQPSRQLMSMCQDKSQTISRSLNFQVNYFASSDVQKFSLLGGGVFGKVYKSSITSMNQVVVAKTVSSSFLDILAECKIGMLMAGHINFPFMYGVVKPDTLLIEFVRDECGAQSPTLNDFFERSLDSANVKNTLNICIGLCKAIHDLHVNGILHNDLHPRNVLIKNNQCVKIIDFGKATLVTDPVRYDIKPHSNKQIKYNKLHLFLAYELRNVPGAHQSIATDTFSVGYNIDFIARHTKQWKLSSVANNMIANDPCKRPPLSQCVAVLERCKMKLE